MAQFRHFNATNKPDTCIWCGHKLRHQPIYAPRATPVDNFVKSGAEPKGGDYRDGHFCGLRCAYSFAVALADHGRRLKPVDDAEGDA